MARESKRTKKPPPPPRPPSNDGWVDVTPVAPPAAAPGPSLAGEWAELLRRVPATSPDAVAAYRAFRERASDAGDLRLAAACGLELGAASLAAGDRRSARIEFQRVLAHAASVGDQALVGAARQGLGTLAEIDGKAEEALRHLVEALPELRAAGDPVRISRCLTDLGVLRAGGGDDAGALAAFREARDLRAGLADAEAVVRLDMNLATMNLRVGRAAEARAQFRGVLDALGKLPADAPAQGLRPAACVHLAACESEAGRVAEALALGGEAATAYAEGENRAALADARHNLGVFAFRAGDIERALQEFNLAASSASAAGLRAVSAESIANLALCHARAGAPEIARRAAQAARAEFALLGLAGGAERTGELLAWLTDPDGKPMPADVLFGPRFRLTLQTVVAR